MSPYEIRLLGDPVLRRRAAEVEDIDRRVARMAACMVPAMYAAGGLGLAAPQVGIQRRLFVYDHCAGEVAPSQPATFRAAATESFSARCRRVQRLRLCFDERPCSLEWAEMFVAWMIAMNEPIIKICE